MLPVYPDKDITEEEETINRKVRPKPRCSKKQAVGNEATTMTKTAAESQTSEYFRSSVKEEEIDSEDDFDLGRSPTARVNKKKVEKDAEGEEDSEEDEDDWEEVEGRSRITFSCWGCLACNQGSNK